MDTLVLNADYRPLSFLPLSVISWQQAVKLQTLDRVDVIEEYDDWEVHSPSITMRVPAVIVTREFMKYKKTVRFSRRGVYLRDLYTCQYCEDSFNDKDLTMDHVVPRSKGGKTNWENIVTACKPCNLRKGNKQIMQPIRLPFKPDVWHIVGNSMKNPRFHIKHPSWNQYINL